MDERADFLAVDDAAQVADDVHIEDVNRQVVVLTHADGREVHHLEVAGEHLGIGDVGELRGGRVFFGVGGVNTIHSRALEHHVGLDFNAAQRRARVSSKIGRARACGENAHFSGFHRVDGAPFRVEFAHRLHADGREHLVGHAGGIERRGERERVDDGGHHAHLVALHAVEPFFRTAEAAEDVAATDDDADFHAQVVDFLDLLCILGEPLHVDARATACGEAFAAEFQKNSFETYHIFSIKNLASPDPSKGRGEKFTIYL